MRLTRFFSVLASITIICLLYVQLQVEIFKQAYIGSLNESHLEDLLDTHSVLMYNTLTLKSAQNVGERLLSHEESLQFAQKQQIAQVAVPALIAKGMRVVSAGIPEQPNFFERIFTLRSQAEANQ